MVGYQEHGSLGRRLLEGVENIKIFGEEIEVNDSISSMGGLSAHAGQSDLLNWFDLLSAFRPIPVLSHGENRSRMPLAEITRNRLCYQSQRSWKNCKNHS